MNAPNRTSTVAPLFEPLEQRLLLDGGPLITEFLAINNTPWYADNPDSDWDWIEIHNPTPDPIALDGWHLTDNRSDLTKWTFPTGTTLDPDEYRIVFASRLDSGDPSHPDDLHAGFKLDGGDPEYLGLVKSPAARSRTSFTSTSPPTRNSLRTSRTASVA